MFISQCKFPRSVIAQCVGNVFIICRVAGKNFANQLPVLGMINMASINAKFVFG